MLTLNRLTRLSLVVAVLMAGLSTLFLRPNVAHTAAQTAPTNGCYTIALGSDFFGNSTNQDFDRFIDDRPPLNFYGEFERFVVTFGANHSSNSGNFDVYIIAEDGFGGFADSFKFVSNGTTSVDFYEYDFNFFEFPPDFSQIVHVFGGVGMQNGGTFDIGGVYACPFGVDPPAAGSGGQPVTLTVDTTDDDLSKQACDAGTANDCSLRGAITNANNDFNASAITIEIPDGTYTLTLGGENEDANNGGDLDIGRSLTLKGTGNNVVIDANQRDRVIQLHNMVGASTDVVIENVTLTGGSVTSATPFHGRDGGAIRLRNATGSLTVVDSTIIDNYTLGAAGAIYATGPLTITSSAILSNTAGAVGGVHADDTLHMTQSVVAYNSTSANAGGLVAVQEAYLANNTISNNTTTDTDARSAGGMVLEHTVTLLNNTIIDNRADNRGKGHAVVRHNASGVAEMTANIIDSGDGAPNCDPDTPNEFTTQGYNVVSDDSCDLSGDATNLENTDPLVRPLRKRYSTLPRYSLDNESPVYNLIPGSSALCQTRNPIDQEGTSRPIAGHCDAGAWENASYIGGVTFDQGHTLSITIPNDAPYVLSFSVSDSNNSQFWTGGSPQWIKPMHGTLDLGSMTAPTPMSREITYTPDSDYVGTDFLSIFAEDFDNFQDGVYDELFVSINIVAGNVAPEAVADVAFTTVNTPITMDVLANDSDADGAPITLTQVGGAVDGTATISGTQVTFTPATDFTGTATFTYTVSDGANDAAGNATVHVGDDTGETTASETASLSISTPNTSDVVVEVEPSDVTTDTVFVLNSAETPTDNTFTFGDIAFSIEAYQNGALVDPFTFANPATFTLNYDDADIAGLDEDLLTLYYYDTATATWREDGITVVSRDTVANAVTFAIDHLTDFAALSTSGTTADDSYSTDENTTLTVDAANGVFANDTVSAGSPVATVIDDVSSGALTLNADGSFEYAPALDFDGTITFTYRIEQAGGTSPSNVSTVTLDVQNVNRAPIAQADTYSTTAGTTLTVPAPGVLDNDSDPDGEALTAVIQSTNAGDGTIALADDGGFVYTPGATYTPVVSFTYEAFDGISGTVATVTIAVNGAPIVADDAYAVNEDNTLTVDAANGVLANDDDAEGDAFTATLVDDVQVGALAFSADGSFTYTPTLDFNGTVTFTYRTNDGNTDSDVATVTLTITPIDDAPSAVDDAYTTDEDVTLTVDFATGLLANDTDVDAGPISAHLITDVTTGTLELNASGAFEYTPPVDFSGTVTFTYEAIPEPYPNIIVNSTADVSTDDGQCTLREAIAAANSDSASGASAGECPAGDGADVIAVPAGLYILGGRLQTSSDITLVGDGIGDTQIDGNDATPLLRVASSTLSVSRLTLQRGTQTDTFTGPILIESSATVTMRDVHLFDNNSNVHGAITNNGILRIENALFSDNFAHHSVGAIRSSGPLYIANSTFLNNAVTRFGIVIAATNDFMLINSTIVNEGGPLLQFAAGATIRNNILWLNSGTVCQGSSTTPLADYNIVSPSHGCTLAPTDQEVADINTVLDTTLANNGGATPTLALVAGSPAIDAIGSGLSGCGSEITVDQRDFQRSGNCDIGAFEVGATPLAGGSTDIATVTITINPVDDPATPADDAYTTDEDVTLTVDSANGVLSNDSDIDGGTNHAALVTDVSTGTLALNADGSFDYVPELDFSGVVTFSYAVTSSGTTSTDGATSAENATVTLTINPINDAPTATDDSDITLMNTPLSVSAPGVLANDTDADSPTLTASLDSAPSNGTATVSAGGAFTYTPTAGFVGSDSFTYSVSDGTLTDTATVHILVVRDSSQPVQIPLDDPNWNLFGWPVHGTTPITDALASIDGEYTTVYGYEDATWHMYDPTLPPEFAAVFNDLDALDYGSGYWINVTAPTTITYGSGRTASMTVRGFGQTTQAPPTTYYGYVTGVSADVTLSAYVDGVLCGSGTTHATASGHVIYGAHVETANCGSAGSTIEIMADGEPVVTTQWQPAGATSTSSVPTAVTLQATSTATTTSTAFLLTAILGIGLVTMRVWRKEQ